ncbi:MAG: hypothetical protein M3320_09705 [Actinomycetota bacterium]|nr:hypothetical protein [Actinomycetota bacterium]
MPLFRRRRGGDVPPRPEWATFFSDTEWASFVDDVLRAAGGEARVDEHGTLTVAGTEAQFGLANLAQKCNAAPRGQWAEVVEDHFHQLLASQARDTRVLTFEEAAPLLRLRVWARDDVPDGADVVEYDLADDLVVVLSLDLPESVATVAPDQLDAWGKDEMELFRLAGDQTRDDPLLEVAKIEVGGVDVVYAVGDDSYFAASQILWPTRLLGDAFDPHGALVGAPNRHLAVLVPIPGMAIVDAIPPVAMLLAQRYADGPGSISPHLYWVRDGESMLRIPLEVSTEGANVHAPDEFVGLLNRLAEA